MERGAISIVGTSGIGLGVFWFAWGKFGFWWGVLYGIGWIPWTGYRFAAWLLS